MSSPLDETLAAVAEGAFGDLAFMFSMPECADGGLAATPNAAASVRFTGPFSGELVLSVSPDALQALAPNMLGLDDETSATAEQQQDALKELTNVVCGNLLPAIGGPAAVFEVSAPALADASTARASGPRTPDAFARLTLDTGGAALSLFIEGGPGVLRNHGICGDGDEQTPDLRN